LIDDSVTGILKSLVSIFPSISVADRIIVNNGDTAMIIGGAGSDIIASTQVTSSIAIGDTATIQFTIVDAPVFFIAQEVISTSQEAMYGLTTSPTKHNDTIIVSSSKVALIMGGISADTVSVNDDVNTFLSPSTESVIVCGDDCIALISNGVLSSVSSHPRVQSSLDIPARLVVSSFSHDWIDINDALSSIIIGGPGSDFISTNDKVSRRSSNNALGWYHDAICGDDCTVATRLSPIPTTWCSIVGTPSTRPARSLDVPAILSVTSHVTASDGNDTISANNGPDLIIGGLGSDFIHGIASLGLALPSTYDCFHVNRW
jgi:Ca2+-binding RTX toxin-like protein